MLQVICGFVVGLLLAGLGFGLVGGGVPGEGQTKTAVLQNTIAAEFNRIHEWERKYSDYLQTVEGYAPFAG